MYLVFLVVILEFIPVDNNPWDRSRLNNFLFVFVDSNIKTSKSYELDRIVDKKIILRGLIRYLIRWKGYGL